MLRTFIVHALPSTSEVKVNALHSSFCVCAETKSWDKKGPQAWQSRASAALAS